MQLQFGSANPDGLSEQAELPGSVRECHALRAQRGASKRNRGAQLGHKGHTRAMLDESEVDDVVECKPEPVCDCGGQVNPGQCTPAPPGLRSATHARASRRIPPV